MGIQLLELCGGPREAVCVLRRRSLEVLGTLTDSLRSRGVVCELAGTDDVGVDPQPQAGLHKRVWRSEVEAEPQHTTISSQKQGEGGKGNYFLHVSLRQLEMH